MITKSRKDTAVEAEVIEAIKVNIGKIDFGQIVIKIQDGQVIQIDAIQRTRIGKFRSGSGEGIEYQI